MKRILLALATLPLAAGITLAAGPAHATPHTTSAAVHAPGAHDTTWGCPGC